MLTFNATKVAFGRTCTSAFAPNMMMMVNVVQQFGVVLIMQKLSFTYVTVAHPNGASIPRGLLWAYRPPETAEATQYRALWHVGVFYITYLRSEAVNPLHD